MERNRRRAFNKGLRTEESKPLNGYSTPENVGYYEAGFNAGEVFGRRQAVLASFRPIEGDQDQ